jgi:DHA2 family multidrug resistance protein
VHDPVEFTEERKQAQSSGHLRIDYVGIALIAIGFACLEVVLDRGERDDWLESHFIATFLVIVVIAIAIAIWWEWRHDDPVVELTLLRERNFAIANLYYFLFAFGLFDSTVLIPEMPQTLFGYTATDAGLVLGPGAAVITLLTPFVVRIVPRIGAKRLLGFSFIIAALSFFYYSGMTTETDYFHFALARGFRASVTPSCSFR